MICPLCHSKEFIRDGHTIHCKKCGCIIQENYITGYVSYKNYTTTKRTCNLIEREKIHKLIRKYPPRKPSTYSETLMMLDEYCRIFDLPPNIKYDAFELYKKLYSSEKLKHVLGVCRNKENFIKALLYLSACNYGYFIHPKKLFGKTW